MKTTWKIVMSSLAMSVALAVGGPAHAQPAQVVIRPRVTAAPFAPRAAGATIVPRVPGSVRSRPDPRCRPGTVRFGDGRCHSRAEVRYRLTVQRRLRPTMLRPRPIRHHRSTLVFAGLR
jgi:hypothetical protein